MKSHKLCFVSLQSAIQAPGILTKGADNTLNNDKYPGIEMYYPDADFPGCMSIYLDGEIVIVPVMNIKSMVIEYMEEVPSKAKQN